MAIWDRTHMLPHLLYHLPDHTNIMMIQPYSFLNGLSFSRKLYIPSFFLAHNYIISNISIELAHNLMVYDVVNLTSLIAPHVSRPYICACWFLIKSPRCIFYYSIFCDGNSSDILRTVCLPPHRSVSRSVIKRLDLWLKHSAYCLSGLLVCFILNGNLDFP